MKQNANKFWQLMALNACLGLVACSAGCWQTTMGGQTLPSAYYLDDDVQYFPTGPEQRLSNQIRALNRFKAEQQGLQDGTASGLNTGAPSNY